jgi:hypothetical protein
MNMQMKCWHANSKNGGTYTSFVISMENKEIIDEIEFELHMAY